MARTYKNMSAMEIFKKAFEPKLSANKNKNALQIKKTKSVDVRKRASNGKEVGKGNKRS